MIATSADSVVSAVRSYLAAVDAVAAVGGGASVPGDARDRTRRVLLERLAGFDAAAHPPCFRRIFVPVDEGDASAWAAAVAGRTAAAVGADVAVCHVLGTSGGFSPEFEFAAVGLPRRRRPSPESLLDRAAHALGAAIAPHRVVRAGDPPAEILAAAREWGADLIVLGARAHGAVARVLLGSTSAAVVRGAHCAVLTVGHEPPLLSASRALSARQAAGAKAAGGAQAMSLPPGRPVPAALTEDQRQQVLRAVEAALRGAEPALFDPAASPTGPMGVVERHLDALVAIVRRTTAVQVEPYLAEILDDVCARCGHQLPSHFCPLRYENACVLFSHTTAVARAIAGALKEMEDPEYWFNHPAGSADLAVSGPAK